MKPNYTVIFQRVKTVEARRREEPLVGESR